MWLERPGWCKGMDFFEGEYMSQGRLGWVGGKSGREDNSYRLFKNCTIC